METINEYLNKTESAAQKIFEGIDCYLKILDDNQRPIFPMFISSEIDEDRFQEEFERWRETHRDEIESSLTVQKQFINESFALSTLCGALLQLAFMGIQQYSNNTSPCEGFEHIIKKESKAAKYCVGRPVRNIPIGLIIYAGRNQYNHFDENDNLSKLNSFIFEKLCKYRSQDESYREPAFDLKNRFLTIYAHNIISILEWRNHEIYANDMKEMVG